MYKHVAKQRKLAASNKELRLSDEESSGDSASEISNSDSDSNSDAGSSDEDGGDAIDEIDEMLAGGSGGEDEEEEEEEEMGPPPAGFPTALEALEAGRSIAEVEEEGETASKADKDVVLVCVVCPNKVLKLGKMLEIHLGSKVGHADVYVSMYQTTDETLDCAGSRTKDHSIQETCHLA